MSLRKSLAALLAVLLTGVMAIGLIGSAAWFTDQDTIAVTGTTGEIAFETAGPHTAGLTLSNLLPGVMTTQYQVDVYNTAGSTTAVKYRITDQFVSDSMGGLYVLVDVTVRHTFCGTPNPAAWPIVYSGALNDLDLNSIDDAIADTLGVNITHCYFFEFGLDSTAGNIYQGQSVAFNLIFDATQPENPGWVQ